MNEPLAWLPAGRRHGFDDLVFWQGRGRETFAEAAHRFDTVVLAPHAGAAFPEELREFIAPQLTRRKQFDFSDVLTGALGHAWAAADPRVVFVANPHARLVLDPNRAPPLDPVAALRTFFTLLRRQRGGETVSFAGVDAIRPITFAGEDVLLEPADESGWRALSAALAAATVQGPAAYRDACARVVDAVVQARPHAQVVVLSLHDTMNATMRADGALVVDRPRAGRLPDWVNFGNCGDERGEAVGDTPLTLPARAARRWAASWSAALDGPAGTEGVHGAAFTLNRPYKGAHETQAFGARLRPRGRADSGALQVEFRREALLGPPAVAALQQPGDDWPAPDPTRLARIAAALARAGDLLRR